ncbi:MAG: histidine phosphatase family protein [bacterium]|nr:histidine phosphatase family protein [bacterium]
MLRVFLIRPGATNFDDQRRMKGRLNIPLSDNGRSQVQATVSELTETEFDVIYVAPCESALETARKLAENRQTPIKPVDALVNVDHGLWDGKSIDEVKTRLPKIYRQWQDYPQTACAPQGESLEFAFRRVEKSLGKLLSKHKSGSIALILPQPLSAIAASLLNGEEIGSLWKSETDQGDWDICEVNEPQKLVAELR